MLSHSEKHEFVSLAVDSSEQFHIHSELKFISQFENQSFLYSKILLLDMLVVSLLAFVEATVE